MLKNIEHLQVLDSGIKFWGTSKPAVALTNVGKALYDTDSDSLCLTCLRFLPSAL